MPANKTVFMFSGQGSQYFQMGRNVFDGDPVFRECMLRMDGIVQELTGNSVVETLYHAGRGKAEAFDRTLLTHPAIFMVEYSLAQSLLQAGVTADLTLGVSLGSFAAATLAGCIGPEAALTAIIRQASILETHCERGGMIAVLGDPALHAQEFLATNSELVGVNFSRHFVVSTLQARFAPIETGLSKLGVAFQRLPVSLAFHSRWIEEAKAPFSRFMQSVALAPGKFPIMCCDHAGLLQELPEGYFWNVTRRAIRFREAIAQLERQGAHRYLDVGPSGTLATFLKYELPSSSASKAHPILTPYGRDMENLAAFKAEVV